jgi:hypothetical protein
MPDLEQQISAWRSQMLSAGIKTPVPLDELESHLREEIAVLIAAGKSEADAFSAAVQKLGPAARLEPEFEKLPPSRPARLWPAYLSLLALTAFFVALHVWTGGDLRDFAIIYCLLLSITLPLAAGPQLLNDSRLSTPWIRAMLAGQFFIGLGGALIIFSPLLPLTGLSLAIISCAGFIGRLRHIAGTGTQLPSHNT